MPEAKSSATQGREDISRFVVHLTRDDTETFGNGGATARENFESIIRHGCILAYRAHCLFNPKLSELPEQTQHKFKVACFTEVPLNQIHLLVRDIPGRQCNLNHTASCSRKSLLRLPVDNLPST